MFAFYLVALQKHTFNVSRSLALSLSNGLVLSEGNILIC